VLIKLLKVDNLTCCTAVACRPTEVELVEGILDVHSMDASCKIGIDVFYDSTQRPLYTQRQDTFHKASCLNKAMDCQIGLSPTTGITWLCLVLLLTC